MQDNSKQQCNTELTYSPFQGNGFGDFIYTISRIFKRCEYLYLKEDKYYTILIKVPLSDIPHVKRVVNLLQPCTYGKLNIISLSKEENIKWKNQRYNYVTNNIYDNDVIIPPNHDFADIFGTHSFENIDYWPSKYQWKGDLNYIALHAYTNHKPGNKFKILYDPDFVYISNLGLSLGLPVVPLLQPRYNNGLGISTNLSFTPDEHRMKVSKLLNYNYNLLQRCKFAFTSESGISHLGMTMGVPLVVYWDEDTRKEEAEIPFMYGRNPVADWGKYKLCEAITSYKNFEEDAKEAFTNILRKIEEINE